MLRTGVLVTVLSVIAVGLAVADDTTGGGAAAFYPPTEAVSSTTTPTLSVRNGNVIGTAGAVRFEVYDATGTALVASGLGTSAAVGARSSWTLPSGLLATGRAYRWRAQAPGTTAWSELADLAIDVVDGDALPAAAPLPAAPGAFVVTGADGGAWVTWSPADAGPAAEIDHYEIVARELPDQNAVGTNATTGPPPVNHLFVADPDRGWKVAGPLSNATSYQWSIRAVSIYGAGPWVSGGTVGGSPVPGGLSSFVRIAQAYLDARGRLLVGSASTVTEAVAPSSDAAAITGVVSATSNTDLDLRSYVARYDARYTGYTSAFGAAIAYWSGPGTVVLQAGVDETLAQSSGATGIDPALHSTLHTFTFSQTGSSWQLISDTTPAEPADTTPPVELGPDAQAIATASVPGVVPLEQTADGMLVTGPELAELQSVALDYYGIAAYAHQHYRSYNRSYHSWANDCTNFVSQAARAGRLPFRGGFYRWESAWFYTGRLIKASLTWAGADNFFRFLWKHNHATFKRYFNQAAVGDILLWDYHNDGHIDHTSIVVRRIGNNVYYAQHSDDKDNALLADGLRRNPGVAVYLARLTQ